jgi:hypothetical protein
MQLRVGGSNEWYVVCLAVVWQIQKALPGWKEPCWGNSGRRADEVPVLNLAGTQYPAAEKEHWFCLA